MANNNHEFAFYLANLSSISKSLTTGCELCIEDKKIFHRINKVLRLKLGETYILFDRSINIKLSLKSFDKKKYIIGTIVTKNKNIALSPKITFLLPLLKREQFESAIYSLVELGAQVIQPIRTKKTSIKWDKKKSHLRYHNIIISAAEQSKNFLFPDFLEPEPFESYINNNTLENFQKIYFDPYGENLSDIIEKIKSGDHKNIMLMSGPEGDLTEKEKIALKKKGFIFCKLTPTVLRSFQSITIGLGAFRSLLSN